MSDDETKDYLLRGIPIEIHRAAMERAGKDGLELKGVLIGLLETYAEQGVRILFRKPATKKKVAK